MGNILLGIFELTLLTIETYRLWEWKRDYDRFVDEYVLEDFPVVNMEGWGLVYDEEGIRAADTYSNLGIISSEPVFPEDRIPTGNQLHMSGYSAVPLGKVYNRGYPSRRVNDVPVPNMYSMYILNGWRLRKPGGKEFEVWEPALRDSKNQWHVKIQ